MTEHPQKNYKFVIQTSGRYAYTAFMKLLLIEDEVKLTQYLKKGLLAEGFVVDVAHSGIDGLHLATEGQYDLIILDGMLPDLDGLGVLQALRQSNKKSTAVLMLTARSMVEDRVKGLQVGADDYLTKPFAFSELVARVHALMRRAGARNKPQVEETQLSLADLELDALKRQARRNGQDLRLTAKEFSLLWLLLRRKGEVISRTELAELVWDMHFDSETNVVDVAIRRLRAKMDDPFDRPLLHTVRGMGYVLELRQEEDLS